MFDWIRSKLLPQDAPDGLIDERWWPDLVVIILAVVTVCLMLILGRGEV